MIPLVLALGLLAGSRGASGGPVLGILEQPQCKPEVAIAVRALFAKRGGEWITLAGQGSHRVALPTAWKVGFEGKSLGTVTTFDPGGQTGKHMSG